MTRIIEKRRSLHKYIALQKAKNLELKLQISQLQALANIGLCTSMIAHEINNLLTPLDNYANLALDNSQDKKLTKKALQKTAKNCARATEVMQSILAVANGETKHLIQTNLLQLVTDIFTCLCRDFTKDNITLKIQIPDDLTVKAVPVEIQQVLMNLILNARDAMLSAGGTLKIQAQEFNKGIKIKVADTGCGIHSKDLQKIFDPFFTTKTKNTTLKTCGSGLGLAFCKKIVDKYNGSITVDSCPARGTTFTINLPNPL